MLASLVDNLLILSVVRSEFTATRFCGVLFVLFGVVLLIAKVAALLKNKVAIKVDAKIKGFFMNWFLSLIFSYLG